MSRNPSLAKRGPNDRDYRASSAAGPKFETVVRRVVDGAKGHDVTASRSVQALDRISAAAKKPADPARQHAPANAVERVKKDWAARPPKSPDKQPDTAYCGACQHPNHRPTRGKFRGRPGSFFICESCKGVL